MSTEQEIHRAAKAMYEAHWRRHGRPVPVEYEKLSAANDWYLNTRVALGTLNRTGTAVTATTATDMARTAVNTFYHEDEAWEGLTRLRQDDWVRAMEALRDLSGSPALPDFTVQQVRRAAIAAVDTLTITDRRSSLDDGVTEATTAFLETLADAAPHDPAPAGLHHKYTVQRTDGKPLKGGQAIVLEVGDPAAHPALQVWADTVEQQGNPDLAADVRSLLTATDEPDLYRWTAGKGSLADALSGLPADHMVTVTGPVGIAALMSGVATSASWPRPVPGWARDGLPLVVLDYDDDVHYLGPDDRYRTSPDSDPLTAAQVEEFGEIRILVNVEGKPVDTGKTA